MQALAAEPEYFAGLFARLRAAERGSDEMRLLITFLQVGTHPSSVSCIVECLRGCCVVVTAAYDPRRTCALWHLVGKMLGAHIGFTPANMRSAANT